MSGIYAIPTYLEKVQIRGGEEEEVEKDSEKERFSSRSRNEEPIFINN